MSKPINKTQLIVDIKTERRRLVAVTTQCSQAEMLLSGVVGDWSVKDLLAHLMAWEQLFLGWYHAGLHHETPEQSPVGMSRRAMDQLNRRIYEKHKEVPLDQVWFEFQASYQQIMAVIESISEEDLFTHQRFAWTEHWTLADYVTGNTCNHYRWAKSKIRLWLKMRSKSNDEQERI